MDADSHTEVGYCHLDNAQPEWIDPQMGDDFDRTVWRVSTQWAVIEERWQCVGFHLESVISPASPAGSVTANAVRMLPIAAIIRGHRAGFRESLEYPGPDPEAPRFLPDGTFNWEAISASTHSPEELSAIEIFDREKPGRYTTEHFLKVALIYHRAWLRQERPARAVSKRWNVSATTAGKWIATARNTHHFLEPTEKRVPNGRLTQEARDLIDKLKMES